MGFNEWVIFIKGSRNWRASKYRSIDYCLIERHGDDDGDDDNDDLVDKAEAMNLFRCLWNESMKILLISWISAWYYIWEMIDDYIYYIKRIFNKRILSWFWINLFNI